MSTATQTWRDISAVGDFRKVPDVQDSVSSAIQSQYADSPRIRGLCQLFQDLLDATPDLSAMLDAVCDPSKSQGVFLDWWGDRVGVSRRLTVESESIMLDDETYRSLIFYRAAANVSQSNIYDMNRLLRQVIKADTLVVDNLDMTIDLRVFGALSDTEEFILKNYGLLCRGAGVGYNLQLGISYESFGFFGSKLLPFNQGILNSAKEG